MYIVLASVVLGFDTVVHRMISGGDMTIRSFIFIAEVALCQLHPVKLNLRGGHSPWSERCKMLGPAGHGVMTCLLYIRNERL